MSIRIVLTDNEITINEEVYNMLFDNITNNGEPKETIYNYINRVINNFDNKDNVLIYMVIQTEKEMIKIKIK